MVVCFSWECFFGGYFLGFLGDDARVLVVSKVVEEVLIGDMSEFSHVLFFMHPHAPEARDMNGGSNFQQESGGCAPH